MKTNAKGSRLKAGDEVDIHVALTHVNTAHACLTHATNAMNEVQLSGSAQQRLDRSLYQAFFHVGCLREKLTDLSKRRQA